MSQGDFEWTDAACDRLRVLWAEKHSTAEIGRRMSVSKNAVVAKAHRLHLPPRPSPIVVTGQPRAQQVRRAANATLPTMADETAPPELGIARPVISDPASPPIVEVVMPTTRYTISGRVSSNMATPQRDAVRGPTLAGVTPPVQSVSTGRVRECSYITDGNGRRARYCDAPTLPGSSYCPTHHAACRVPVRVPVSLRAT